MYPLLSNSINYFFPIGNPYETIGGFIDIEIEGLFLGGSMWYDGGGVVISPPEPSVAPPLNCICLSRQLLERVCQLVPQQQHVVPTAEWHVERRGDERRESKTAQGAPCVLVLLVAYSLRVLPYGQAEFHAERLNYAEFVAYARPYVFRHAYVRLCALQPHCVINAYVQRGCLPLRLLGGNGEDGKYKCPYGSHCYSFVSCSTLFHSHEHVFKINCNLIELFQEIHSE